MKYHINYDGRILPCRAKVKKCPYGPSRHADSYEELYLRAMQLYNHAPVDNDLKVKLNSGKMLSDLSPISPELEKSKAPIETLLSTLKYAMSSVDSGKMPYELKKEENAAANSCARIIALDSTIPQWVPQNIKDKANDIFARSNYKLEKWSPVFANDNDTKDQREYLENHKKEIILTKSWHNTI